MLLYNSELGWRMKGYAFWFEIGYYNAIFFHWYVNQRKNHNTIYELKNGEGQFVIGFKNLAEMGVQTIL